MEIPEDIQTLAALLHHLDTRSGGLRPIELDSALRVLAQSHPEAETKAGHAWYDEVAAGSMILLHQEGSGPWGLEYGPVMEGQSADGSLLTYPNLDRLDLQTLEYWRSRARETSNALLKGRYADLAWVFSERLNGVRSIEDARLAIDGFLASMASFPEDYDVDAIHSGQRAMTLALRIHDQDRQNRIKDEMFALAKRLEPVPFPLNRSFLLAGFGLGQFTKVRLADEEHAYMLWLLEDRLEHERNSQEVESPTSIWDAENAAQLLSAYYRKTQQPSGVRRVLEAFGVVAHRRADLADPLAGQAWLESFARLCEEHGQKDMAIRATQAIRALGPNALGSLKRFGHEMEIPEEQLKEFLGQFVQGDLAEALGRLAVNMVPKWDHVVQNTKDIASQTVISSLVRRTLLDIAGHPIVHLPSYHEKPEAHFPMAFAQWIQMEGFFRFRVIEAIKASFSPTPEEIAEWLLLSPAYPEERRSLLVQGLASYFADDHIACIHILVPQIEEAARTASGLLGDSIFEWQQDRDGVKHQDARSLNAVLSSQRLEALLGQNHIMFLRVTLVLHQGLNLRNRLAHGLLLPEEFGRAVSDIVFQCLLIFGLLHSEPGANS